MSRCLLQGLWTRNLSPSPREPLMELHGLPLSIRECPEREHSRRMRWKPHHLLWPSFRSLNTSFHCLLLVKQVTSPGQIQVRKNLFHFLRGGIAKDLWSCLPSTPSLPDSIQICLPRATLRITICINHNRVRILQNLEDTNFIHVNEFLPNPDNPCWCYLLAGKLIPSKTVPLSSMNNPTVFHKYLPFPIWGRFLHWAYLQGVASKRSFRRLCPSFHFIPQHVVILGERNVRHWRPL